MFVQAIILRCVAWLSGMSVHEMSRQNVGITAAVRARHVLQTMVDGVCASVPTHIGYSEGEDPNIVSECLRSYALDTLDSIGSTATPFIAHRLVANDAARNRALNLHEIGGYLMLYPLLVARSATFIPEQQHTWIGARILDIAKHSGLDETMIINRMTERPEFPLFET